MNRTKDAAGTNPPSGAFGWPTLLLAVVLAWIVVLLSGYRDHASAGPDAAAAAESLRDAVAAV